MRDLTSLSRQPLVVNNSAKLVFAQRRFVIEARW